MSEVGTPPAYRPCVHGVRYPRKGLPQYRAVDIVDDSIVEEFFTEFPASMVPGTGIDRAVVLTVGDIVRVKRCGPIGKIWGRLKNKEVRVNSIYWGGNDFPVGFLTDAQSTAIWRPGIADKACDISPIWVQVSDTWLPFYSLWRVDEKRRSSRNKNTRGAKRSKSLPSGSIHARVS